jgi:hypothetical protein
LVPRAQVGGERVGVQLGPLGKAAAGAHPGVGLEVDLHGCAGTTTGADVAALDDDVAVVGELPLAVAHHLAHLGCRATTGRAGRSRRAGSRR